MAKARGGKIEKRDQDQAQGGALSLAPLSFEEALADLLQVAPPAKDEQPEREPPKEPPRRQRQSKQDKEKGSQ